MYNDWSLSCRLARETRQPLNVIGWIVSVLIAGSDHVLQIKWELRGPAYCNADIMKLQFKGFRKQQKQTKKLNLFSEYNYFILLLQEFVKCKKFVQYLVTRTEGKVETLGDLVDVSVLLKFILSN
jgi:hypothetical protein